MFQLDKAAASAADNKSSFIEEAGKYIGTLTRAEYMEKSDTGSTGIGLTFKTREGAEAKFYINLTYHHVTKNDGGYSLINAIMACLSLRNVGAPQQITVEKWDKDAGQRVKSNVQGFPELMGKPLGLLIQMEIEKNSEKGNERPTIFAPFSAESEKTASEILDQRCTSPAKLEKMVQQIAKKPCIDRRPKGGTGSAHGGSHGNDLSPPADWDDQDIPFD